jgi:hypothetical protein
MSQENQLANGSLPRKRREQLEYIKKLLLNTVNECSSIIKVKRSSSKPWINANILKLIRTKRALWKTFKRTGEQIDYAAHIAFSNRLSTIIKEERIYVRTEDCEF